MSTPWICNTCGTQYAASDAPPASCPVCEDDRQYVDWAGQRWVTHAELQQKYTLQLGDDDGVFGIDMPGFAIPQRAMLLPTDAGNLLMEVLPMVNNEAVGALKARGGVDRIVISHPHFYASMVEWSEALGGVPILLHAADKSWVRRPSARLQFWEGDTLQLSDDVTLIILDVAEKVGDANSVRAALTRQCKAPDLPTLLGSSRRAEHDEIVAVARGGPVSVRGG